MSEIRVPTLDEACDVFDPCGIHYSSRSMPRAADYILGYRAALRDVLARYDEMLTCRQLAAEIRKALEE